MTWGSSVATNPIPDPQGKMGKEFSVLAFPPSEKTSCWVYSTLGMSTDTPDALMELHILSDKEDATLVELLTVTASFHRTGINLGLHHTVNFGRPWQDDSACSYGFLSLPYLSGEALETFDFGDGHLHNLWLLPITESERNYKIENGWEALEERFEEYELDYLNPQRSSCI